MDSVNRARAHWYRVLRLQPRNRLALEALNLQWYRGLLLTTEQADWRRQQADDLERQQKELRPKIKHWRRIAEDGDTEQLAQMLNELRELEEDLAFRCGHRRARTANG